MPRGFIYQAVPRSRSLWNGDVWKNIVESRTKLEIDTYVIHADQGIGMILKRPNKVPILFETKNYAINVKKDEVDKFIRDIDNTKYNGIMLSQTSGIICKDNFQIDIHNNNILVYIHKADYDISKIKLAVNTIDFLSDKILTMKDNKINIDAELLKEINSEYQQLIVIKDEQKSNFYRAWCTHTRWCGIFPFA
jgi:hypothetical protein